jgi:hypothetical protein
MSTDNHEDEDEFDLLTGELSVLTDALCTDVRILPTADAKFSDLLDVFASGVLQFGDEPPGLYLSREDCSILINGIERCTDALLEVLKTDDLPEPFETTFGVFYAFDEALSEAALADEYCGTVTKETAPLLRLAKRKHVRSAEGKPMEVAFAVRQVAPPEGGRVETGALQFGDDWPGLFVRGDEARGLSLSIKAAFAQIRDTAIPGELWQQLGPLSELRNIIEQKVIVR